MWSEDRDSFYTYLFSNASTVEFRDNTLTSFTNVLARPLHVRQRDRWHVGLIYIDLTNKRGLNEDGDDETLKRNYAHIETDLVGGEIDGNNVLTTFITHAYDGSKNQLRTRHTPKHPTYLPLQSEVVRHISIRIRDEKGAALNLAADAPTEVLLHFRKMGDSSEYRYHFFNVNSRNPHYPENTQTKFRYDFPRELSLKPIRTMDVALVSVRYPSRYKRQDVDEPTGRIYTFKKDFMPPGGGKLGTASRAEIRDRFIYAMQANHEIRRDAVSRIGLSRLTIGVKRGRLAPLNIPREDEEADAFAVRAAESLNLINGPAIIPRRTENLPAFAHGLNRRGVYLLFRKKADKPQLEVVVRKPCILELPLIFALKAGFNPDYINGNRAVMFYNRPHSEYRANPVNVDLKADEPTNAIIYSSMLEPTYLGATFGQILNTMPLARSAEVGLYSQYEPERLQFHEINVGDLTNITFEVLLYSGQPLPFADDVSAYPVNMTLCVRERICYE